jgi:hypothetical protein
VVAAPSGSRRQAVEVQGFMPAIVRGGEAPADAGQPGGQVTCLEETSRRGRRRSDSGRQVNRKRVFSLIPRM